MAPRTGHIDVLWHNATTGHVGVWIMNGATVQSDAFLSWQYAGTEWQLRGTGDFNRDGHIDVLWHNATTGQVSVWIMNGTTVQGAAAVSWSSVGTAWQIKGTGDFNRDGHTDVLWHNATTGHVGVWLMSGTTVLNQAFASWNVAGDSWEIVSR